MIFTQILIISMVSTNGNSQLFPDRIGQPNLEGKQRDERSNSHLWALWKITSIPKLKTSILIFGIQSSVLDKVCNIIPDPSSCTYSQPGSQINMEKNEILWSTY